MLANNNAAAGAGGGAGAAVVGQPRGFAVVYNMVCIIWSL